MARRPAPQTTPDVDGLQGSLDDLDDDLKHRMVLHCMEHGVNVDERRMLLDMLGLSIFEGRDLRTNTGGQYRWGIRKFEDTGYVGPTPSAHQSAAQ